MEIAIPILTIQRSVLNGFSIGWSLKSATDKLRNALLAVKDENLRYDMAGLVQPKNRINKSNNVQNNFVQHKWPSARSNI